MVKLLVIKLTLNATYFYLPGRSVMHVRACVCVCLCRSRVCALARVVPARRWRVGAARVGERAHASGFVTLARILCNLSLVGFTRA